MISTLAVYPPSTVCTVTVAVPTDTPKTRPSASTVATASSEDVKRSAGFVAFAGVTVTFSRMLLPSSMRESNGSKPMPVTGTVAGSTITQQVATRPLPVATAITACPAACASKRPLASTDTTSRLELVHSTVLSVAFKGNTVAVSDACSPTVRESEEAFKLTLVAGMSTGRSTSSSGSAVVSSSGVLDVSSSGVLDVSSSGVLDVSSSGVLDVSSSGVLDVSSPGVLDVSSSGVLDVSSSGVLGVSSSGVTVGISVLCSTPSVPS